MTVPSIITSNSITVLVGGRTLVAKASHPNFPLIRDYVKAGAPDTATLASLFDIPTALAAKSQGRVTIQNDTVFYDGKPLHTTLTARMLTMLAEGFDIQPLTRFLEKLMRNPSHRAVTGLYDFLEATHIPITPEGNFLAYKKVRPDFHDIHSGTIRNAVGDAPRVQRNEVDEDPDRTCSHGLHVCSASYLPHFGSSGSNDHIMIVEVDPEDVVAIPRDYNNAKMRCAGYKVIAEVPPEQVASIFSAPVMSETDFRSSTSVSEGARTMLSASSTDVIRNIHGNPVRFVFDEEPLSWDGSGAWVAYFDDEDGEENVYETECFDSDDLDEAVEEFIENCMEEVEDWAAELRWLDYAGDLNSEAVVITSLVGDTVLEEEFTDAAEIAPSEVDVRVVGVRRVPDSRRWQFVQD
jgi:hypothetical protein